MILYYISLLLYRRVLDRFFGIRDSEFKSKIGTRFGIEIMFGRGMPKITLGITGLHKILGRNYGIEEPYWGPSYRYSIRLSRCDVLKKTCCFAANLSPFYNRGYPVWSPFIWRKLVPSRGVTPLPDLSWVSHLFLLFFKRFFLSFKSRLKSRIPLILLPRKEKLVKNGKN